MYGHEHFFFLIFHLLKLLKLFVVMKSGMAFIIGP